MGLRLRAPVEFVRHRATAPAVRNAYEAGSQSRRVFGWQAPTTTPNSGVLSNLSTLRDRSRAATRNDGYIKGGIEKLTTNIVGTGGMLRSAAIDPDWRARIDAAFDRWTEYCDADGQLDWYGLQTLAVRGWLEGGETFTRKRPRLAKDGFRVPLQLQVLEADFCPHTHTLAFGASRIRAGIQFSAIGAREGYWLHPSRPEQDDIDTSQLKFLPATDVVHLYDPLRAGQIRGIPQATAALVRMFTLDKYDDANLVRQHLANLFVGFRKAAPSSADQTINPLTGMASTDTTGDRPMVGLEPGLMQELDPGEEIDWSDPPDPPTTYEAFIRQQLRAAANAVGVPYELFTGDMTGVNDRTVRVILSEFRRHVMRWQHQILGFKLGRTVWNWFIDAAFMSGALPFPIDYATNREAYAAVEWAPHGWPYIHPVQDVESQNAAIRSGLTSRQAVVAEQGENAADIDRQQAEDNARADELKLRYDSDGRQAPRPTSSQSRDEVTATQGAIA